MEIKIQNHKLYVIKYSVLLFLQTFLILVKTENVTDIKPDGPNITFKSYPSYIEFNIEDPSYNIIKVDCKNGEIVLNNCTNLEPCTPYQAELQIEYTNSSNNDTSIIKNSISVKTNYSEPKVALREDKITTKPYSIYIQWDVIFPKCVSLFKVKATAENKVYMDVHNDKNNITFPELNPCQKYDIEIVTIDINDKVIEPNLTTAAETEYDEPDGVNSLRFEPSNKSIQAFWKTPAFTTCINSYDIKWKKKSCSIQESDLCHWQTFKIVNPKTTDYVIDNLEGCENYMFVISINGDHSGVCGSFTSLEQKPGPITNFLISDSTATNVTFNWNLPSENGKCVSLYKINIIGPAQNIELNDTSETSETEIFFDDLKPCGIYNITITPISIGNILSDKFENTITMIHAKPNTIRNLHYKYHYPHEILLKWEKPIFSELCIDHYRISGWSNDDINNTNYQFHKQTNLTTQQISNLISCMTYIVQVIPVIIGSEPSFDGNPTQLKIDTLASTTANPTVNIKSTTSKSLEIRAINNDEKNLCPIFIARFKCTAKNARINYAEKTVEGDIVRTFLATVAPLSPFTKYKCEVYLYNIAGKSPKTEIVLTTDKYYPEEPIDVKAVIANNTLYINWDKPIYLNGDLIFYKVFIQIVGPYYKIPSHCKTPQKTNIFYEHLQTKFDYKDIESYYQYSIQVATRNDYGTGKSTKPVLIISQPSVSNSVENFEFLSIDGPEISDVYNASVLLQWQAPCKSNGIIKLYELEFYGTRNGFNNHYFVQFIKSDEINETYNYIQWRERNLLPEYNYMVSIRIQNIGVVAKSEPAIINFLSPAGIPDIVNNTNSGVVDAFSSTNPTNSALVKIPLNIFRSEMGKILYAAVLLSEIGCQKDPDLISGKINIDNNWPNISNWQKVKSETCITQYQTTPEHWEPFTKSKSVRYFSRSDSLNSENILNDIIEYVIGNEINCNADKLYCNGPLKPNTKYKMILRVFTRNGFADTVSLEFKTDDEVKIYLILIMIVSVLLIAFFLGFIYMWINKRKIWYRQSLNGIEDQCGDVTTRNYLLHYHDLSKKDKILREFKELDVVSNDANSKNIFTRYNDSKNRYSNIFPYENNRVILDSDSDGSDYINASFINGYQRKKEYIATQGPKPESFVDFWKMIVQHNVKIIVMVTQLREGDTIKCHQYFPIMSNEMKFGNNITVSCTREIENDIYERRDMIVKHSGDHIYRNIVHYYFKKWPDHDCPSDTMDLITFVKRIKSEKKPSRSPIVVHCSAGVGRTGTFIGLDIIMQRMKNEGKINIYETIKQLRFERMKMVQTIQQYQFLYNCIYQIVLNKYTRDSKKNSLTTNNSSTITIITPPSTPAISLSQQLSPSILTSQQLTTPILKPLHCNGYKKQDSNSGNLSVINNNQNNDTISSRNSSFSPNDIESVM